MKLRDSRLHQAQVARQSGQKENGGLGEPSADAIRASENKRQDQGGWTPGPA